MFKLIALSWDSYKKGTKCNLVIENNFMKLAKEKFLGSVSRCLSSFYCKFYPVFLILMKKNCNILMQITSCNFLAQIFFFFSTLRSTKVRKYHTTNCLNAAQMLSAYLVNVTMKINIHFFIMFCLILGIISFYCFLSKFFLFNAGFAFGLGAPILMYC